MKKLKMAKAMVNLMVFDRIVPTITFLAATIIVCSCSDKTQMIEEEKPFCITDTMMRKVRIDTVKMENVESEITLSGKITFDEGKVIKIYPMVGGIIREVKVELGDYVEKGQALATLQSSDIATLEKDLEVAESNLSIAEKNMDVAQELYKSGYGTEKEYITAQKEYQKAQSELTRTKTVLNLFGKSDRNSNYIIRAPISGFLVEKNINSDMQLRPDLTENIFTISNLKDVWVMANVYESDISKINMGYNACVTTLSYPDKVFKGKIDKIFNVIDPTEKVMKVRIKLDNPDYILKPEMHAIVTVSHKEDNIEKLSIPSQALIFDKNRNFVMIYNDKCSITTREVFLYKEGKSKTYISDGLKAGEKIISQSQLYIYDALND